MARCVAARRSFSIFSKAAMSGLALHTGDQKRKCNCGATAKYPWHEQSPYDFRLIPQFTGPRAAKILRPAILFLNRIAPRRTLLTAAEYPFRKIVGVELIAELHRAAEAPRVIWIVDYDPRLETTLSDSRFLEKAGGTPQYSVYRQAGG